MGDRTLSRAILSILVLYMTALNIKVKDMTLSMNYTQHNNKNVT
jgi:hypothetical protein